jgi:flagellar biosynthesis/type III secretory pathway protein FliH
MGAGCYLSPEEKAYENTAKFLVEGTGVARTREMIIAEVRSALARAFREGVAEGKREESANADRRLQMAIDNAVRALDVARKV